MALLPRGRGDLRGLVHDRVPREVRRGASEGDNLILM